MSILEIKNFTKIYNGKKKAVDSLTFSIEAGDIFGFIGAKGTGKTTTLKAAAGIHDFDEGEISIGGHSIKRDPIACKSMLAYIPDNPDLYEHLTGYQYINFIADPYNIPTSQRTQAVKKYSDLFEIY